MQLELIFPLLLLQPSSILRKTLISIWRIRILGFHHYGSTPLQPYWAMTLLMTMVLPLDNGYTSKVYTTYWTYSVGTKKNSKAIPAQQVYSLDDHGQGLYLRTNQIKQMRGLITYMKHVFGAFNSDIDPRNDPFHPFTPDEWSQQTSTMLRTYLIQHLPNPNEPEPVPSRPIPSSRPTGYSPAAIELMGFKMGIKREIAAYPSLKEERYFDGFKRSLLIVAKTHECNEVLDPNYTPGSAPEEQELFEANQASCLVSLMLTFKLKWGRPLSEDNWQILMFSQYGQSSVST